VWLIGVVVVTDIAGYFAGRLIGGPKFWPRLSPKKTWSGTVAGWLGAALVGWAFQRIGDVGAGVVPLSVLLCMASQSGDIAESALKRRMGVKDSSQLIPGHGGMFDRFDAMLGASIFILVFAAVFGVPGRGREVGHDPRGHGQHRAEHHRPPRPPPGRVRRGGADRGR
jgi:phosphatidate cytidylyltransferase